MSTTALAPPPHPALTPPGRPWPPVACCAAAHRTSTAWRRAGSSSSGPTAPSPSARRRAPPSSPVCTRTPTARCTTTCHSRTPPRRWPSCWRRRATAAGTPASGIWATSSARSAASAGGRAWRTSTSTIIGRTASRPTTSGSSRRGTRRPIARPTAHTSGRASRPRAYRSTWASPPSWRGRRAASWTSTRPPTPARPSCCTSTSSSRTCPSSVLGTTSFRRTTYACPRRGERRPIPASRYATACAATASPRATRTSPPTTPPAGARWRRATGGWPAWWTGTPARSSTTWRR